jgi:hypothetical protein
MPPLGITFIGEKGEEKIINKKKGKLHCKKGENKTQGKYN